jgi:V/A-type H+-transporting ATPase subunit D
VLAGELWKLMRDVLEGRARLDGALREAVKALGLARALDGSELLESLAQVAGRDLPLRIDVRRVWGVPTPSVSAPDVVRTADARGTSPASWGIAGAEAARRHEHALELLLRIASRELHLQRLGEEIQATSRRINALEQLVLPSLDGEASRIDAALSERDREDAVRLKRFRARRRSAAGAPRVPTAGTRRDPADQPAAAGVADARG